MAIQLSDERGVSCRRVVCAGALALILFAVGKPAAGQALSCQTSGLTFTCQVAPPSAGAAAGQPWATSGNNIYTTNTDNVGIGMSTPSSRLHLDGDLTISKNGTTYLTTETNAYPMTFFKSPPHGNPARFGRVGLYGDTAFLSNNVFFNMTNWVADDSAAARSMVLLQQGVIRFQTQAAGGPNGLFSRMFIGRDVTMAFNNADEKVGIGTNTPTAKLTVVGDISATGNIAARYQDVAEWVRARGVLAPGTVVVIGASEPDIVKASQQSYDTAVAGVVSPQPGIVLGEEGLDKVLVAHSGRVRVKVDASSGAIDAGDLLVTSSTPGYAMRSEAVDVGGAAFHRPGTLLGKALETLESGQGEILVLLTLQ